MSTAPGRINLIGEHTDYNDGFVLPGAVDKKVSFLLARNQTAGRCRVHALDEGEAVEFSLEDLKPMKQGGWQNYIIGVAAELRAAGADLQGFDAMFSGDVPLGAGLSSSAALECALATGLNDLFGAGFSRPELARLSQMAEHHYAGIKCGIMDQFASMMGQKDHVILLDCRSLAFQYFPLELGAYQLLLLNTNVSHSLASSEYNTRRAECGEGTAALQKAYPSIEKLRDVSLKQLTAKEGEMPAAIFRRCRHVVGENQRVLQATQALLASDFKRLGELMYQSHFSLQNDYEVSCPELDFLVQQTLEKDYILGSRMMGGGFGGCTISIIEKGKAAAFVDAVSKSYHSHFGIALTPIEVAIGHGAATR